MITLDMAKKSTKVTLTEKAFSLETGVLGLQISLGTYDLTDKTITAVFDATGIETAPLDVVADVIQLPITQGLVASGYNNIQLNIREGLTLDQSPIMVWQVMPSLVGTDPAPTAVDIITALLAQAAATVARAEAAESVTGGDKLATAADRIATGADRAAVNGALANFDDVTLPAAVQTVDDETAAQILLVEGAGDAELSAIADAGDVQVGRVADEGTDQIVLVQAEGDAQIVLVQAEGDAQILRVQGAGDAELLDIGDAGDAQVLRVTGEGDTQVGRVTSEGGTQVGLVQAAGAVQVAAVQAELPYIRENIAKDQQDIKQLEHTLVQLNPSGDAKVTVTGYDTITSLPKNTAQAGLSVVQGGMTAQNKVTNGDFSNGTTGWVTYASTISALNNILYVTGNGTYLGIKAVQITPITCVTNKKIYVKTIIRVTNSSAVSVKIDIDGSNGGGAIATTLNAPISNNWYTLSGIGIIPGSMKGFVKVTPRSDYIDAVTANGKVMEIQYVLAIDLTALFGTGNEPTAATCDKIFADYFNATQSAITGRVRSVGKNLFDKTTITPYYRLNEATGELVSSGTFCVTDFMPVLPNTTYKRSGVADTNSRYCFYDKDKKYISGATKVNAQPTTAETRYVRNSFEIVSIDTVQYEKGSTATAYESYRKTEQYTKPLPLYRVPNGVRDTIEAGKHYQRIKRYVLLSANMAVYTTTKTNFDYVSIPLTVLSEYQTKGSTVIDEGILVTGFIGDVLGTVFDGDSDACIGHIYVSDAYLNLCVAKGLYANLAAAQAALAGTVIYYQLAVPIITDNVTSGTLLAYPSGTIYWEPVIADIGIYGASLAILNTAYPIASIERIYKIDPISGSQLELNPASAVVASGGLSFTHPSAASGDLISFTYFYSHAYPYGSNSYTYYDSNVVSIDTVTAKAYRYKPVVTNGVIASWALTEVV